MSAPLDNIVIVDSGRYEQAPPANPNPAPKLYWAEYESDREYDYYAEDLCCTAATAILDSHYAWAFISDRAVDKPVNAPNSDSEDGYRLCTVLTSLVERDNLG